MYPRFLLLLVCTVATFLVSGRAPGLSTPRTRDIEVAISAEGKGGREKKPAFGWRGDPKAA